MKIYPFVILLICVAVILPICIAVTLLFSYSSEDEDLYEIYEICEDIRGIEVKNIKDIEMCLELCNKDYDYDSNSVKYLKKKSSYEYFYFKCYFTDDGPCDADKYYDSDSAKCLEENPSYSPLECYLAARPYLGSCFDEIRLLKNYACKDGKDSCTFSKRKKKYIEMERENFGIIIDRRKKKFKESKLQCEVFGCDVAKDSSFFMITEYDIISNYNRKYLLMTSEVLSDFMKVAIKKEIPNEILLPNKDSVLIRDILPDCKIKSSRGVSVGGKSDPGSLFYGDSKCDFGPMIKNLSPNADFFCLEYGNDKYYTLLKEKGSIGKILKLKSENLGSFYEYLDSYTREFFNREQDEAPEERDFRLCLAYLYSIEIDYGYDFIYMHPFYQSEICDLNRWRGVRLKEQPGKNMPLKSLFVVPQNCFSI